jgi:hypothetical protein
MINAKLNLFTKYRILKNDLKPKLYHVLHSQQNIYCFLMGKMQN